MKVENLKDMIKTLQGMRDQIVITEEAAAALAQMGGAGQGGVEAAVLPKNLFEEMGDMETLKAAVFSLLELCRADERLSHFFHYTDSTLFTRRIAHFFAHLGGATEEWIGKPVDEAHHGRFIRHEHFDLFLTYTEQALLLNGINDLCIPRFMELLKRTRPLIVFDEEQDLTFWQKLDYRNKFDALVNHYVEKLALDSLFSEYFSQNIMMKHMIHSIVTGFFAQSCQGEEGTKAPILQTYGLVLT